MDPSSERYEAKAPVRRMWRMDQTSLGREHGCSAQAGLQPSPTRVPTVKGNWTEGVVEGPLKFFRIVLKKHKPWHRFLDLLDGICASCDTQDVSPNAEVPCLLAIWPRMSFFGMQGRT